MKTGESKDQDIDFGESQFRNERESAEKVAGMFLLRRLKKGDKDSSLNADVMPGIATARVRPGKKG